MLAPMRAKPWSAVWLLLGAGACSNLIGVSGYKIDPSLDDDAGGSAGTSHGGTSSTTDGGDPPVGGGGSGDTTAAGEPNGGSDPGGGSATMAGAPPDGGSNGAAGEPPVLSGCQGAEDCDDTIDCTVDSCDAGECVHTADTTLCDASNCEACVAGVDCMAGAKSTSQLLLDPNFDDATSGWKIYVDPDDPATSAHIETNPVALSSPKVARLGPAAADASEYLYGDLYQNVSMPPKLVAVSLTLSYRFTPGAKNTDEEYVAAALYKKNAVDPFSLFHRFDGDSAAQTTWKSVTYKAPQDEVAGMVGKQFTFDLVAHSFDGVYLFDNVRLEATVCQ